MSSHQESATGLPLARVAELTGGRVEDGDDALTIRRVAPLDRAGPDALGLLADTRYARGAEESSAGAFLVSEALLERAPAGRPRVVVADAHAALIPVLAALHPEPSPPPGVHPTAVLGPGVRLGEGVSVGPYAVVGEDAVLGDRTQVGAHVVVGAGVKVGQDCVVHPQVTLYPRTQLGDRVIVHSGSRLGVDGFGYTWRDGAHRKIPQVGRCIVEDDVEIGANTAIDRGSIGDTVVGKGTKVDNLVQLAHNVRLGPHCAVAGQVGIAGSTRVGAGVLFGGQAGVIGHLTLGDGVRVAAAARVMRDVPDGEVVAGDPSRPNREYLRRQALVGRLPSLVDRVKRLERAVEGLGGGEEGPADPEDSP